MSTMRIPPHSLDAERALLGYVLADGAAVVTQAEGTIGPDDFYLPAHAAVWASALAIVKRGHAVDQVTVRDDLTRSGQLENVGGDEYLLGLSDSLSASDPETLAKMIRDAAQRRAMIRICQEQASAGYSGANETGAYIAETEARIFAAARDSAVEGGGLESTTAGLQAFWTHVQSVNANGGILGVRTGIPPLDASVLGLWDEDLVVVGARPSMGKTAFLETVLINVARELNPRTETALFFSAEMGHVTLWPRLLAKIARMDSRAIRSIHPKAPGYADVCNAVDETHRMPMQIDTTTGISIAQIRSRARKAATKRRVRLVCVDYLQLIHASTKHERRDLEVAEVAIGLKALARELHCPVVAAAQINRGVAGRSDKRPMISDIRDSGQVEQSADTIFLLHREAYYAPNGGDLGKAEIIVGKNRNGMTGVVASRYLPELCEFVADAETR